MVVKNLVSCQRSTGERNSGKAQEKVKFSPEEQSSHLEAVTSGKEK